MTLHDNRESINAITLSGRIINEPVQDMQFLMFTLRHVRSSKEPAQLFECRVYTAFGRTPDREVIRKGNEVVVEGTLQDGPFKKLDRRYVGNHIDVETIRGNAAQPVRLPDGKERLLPPLINEIILNGTLPDEPSFGKNGSWVRFELYFDQGMGSFRKRCLMFAPRDSTPLPAAILRKDARVAVRGAFHMDTFQDPQGKEEIYVEELLSDERYITDIRFEEREAPRAADRRSVSVVFESWPAVTLLTNHTRYGSESVYIPTCDHSCWLKCNPVAALCKDWLHGAEARPDVRHLITPPPAGVKVRGVQGQN